MKGSAQSQPKPQKPAPKPNRDPAKPTQPVIFTDYASI